MQFSCSICGEPSTRICISCTKDTCANHLCAKCHRCSDCCECEDPVAESTPETELTAVDGTDPLAASQAVAEPAGAPAEDVAREAGDQDVA